MAAIGWRQLSIVAPVLLVTTSCGRDAPEVHGKQALRWDEILDAMEWPGVPWREAGKLRDWFLHQEEFQEYAGPLEELYISVNFKDPSTVVLLTLSRRKGLGSTSALIIAAVVFYPQGDTSDFVIVRLFVAPMLVLKRLFASQEGHISLERVR